MSINTGVISSFLALPSLVSFYPFSVHTSAFAVKSFAIGNDLSQGDNAAFGFDELLPIGDLTVTPSGAGNYWSVADNADQSITGTETHIASAYRGLTIGGLFFPTISNSDVGLVGKWAATNQRSYLLTGHTGSGCSFKISDNGSDEDSVVGSNLPIGQWTFIVGRFDPSTELALFLNGAKDAVSTSSIPSSIDDGTGEFAIGRETIDNTYFIGYVSCVFLCKMVLPDSLILELYNEISVLLS